MKEGVKLSIIVPVYNDENYIRDCLDSIFRQGLDEDDFEVIIINDGAEDNSMIVITDIISLHHNIEIINQENQGVSVARNKGIAIANGEYLLMVDADDLLIEGKLKQLLEKAVETKADLIVPDFIEIADKEITKSKISLLTTSDQAHFFYEKSGKEMYLNDLHPSQCYIWRILYKKDFLVQNHILFVPGIHFQDIPFITECYITARKCIKTSLLLYIYRKKNIVVTHGFSLQINCENAIAIAKTWELISRYQLTGSIREKLQDNVYTNFTYFSLRVSHFSKDFNEREYVFNRLRQNAPDLYFTNNRKQRLISYMFWHYPTFYNCTYYFFKEIILSYYYRVNYKIIHYLNKSS